MKHWMPYIKGALYLVIMLYVSVYVGGVECFLDFD